MGMPQEGGGRLTSDFPDAIALLMGAQVQVRWADMTCATPC